MSQETFFEKNVSAVTSTIDYFDGSVQDCSISIANVQEILQACIKLSICELAMIVLFSSGPRWKPHCMPFNGPLTSYVKLRVAHAPEMPGTFSPPPRVRDPDMHHGTCVTHGL